MKLKSKKEIVYSGKVFDLTIKNSHSYNVEGLAVHNSSSGCLINYLLDITKIDPIRHNLLFERFLSLQRKELADVDTDLEMKEQILDIFREHFGTDNVLAISNYNRLQLKSLIKDISRLYNVPFEEVNICTKAIEKEARDQILDDIGDDQKLYELTYERALKYSPTLQKFIEKYPQVGERIENLYQEVKSTGKHARRNNCRSKCRRTFADY